MGILVFEIWDVIERVERPFEQLRWCDGVQKVFCAWGMIEGKVGGWQRGRLVSGIDILHLL